MILGFKVLKGEQRICIECRGIYDLLKVFEYKGQLVKRRVVLGR